MGKVYCFNCRHYRTKVKGIEGAVPWYMCAATAQKRDTPMQREYDPKSIVKCEERNKDNNCEHYKKRKKVIMFCTHLE